MSIKLSLQKEVMDQIWHVGHSGPTFGSPLPDRFQWAWFRGAHQQEIRGREGWHMYSVGFCRVMAAQLPPSRLSFQQAAPFMQHCLSLGSQDNFLLCLLCPQVVTANALFCVVF